MSGGLDVLALKEDDVTKMLAAGVHLGSNNVGFQMEQYVFKRNPSGVHIIDLKKAWEKLNLAARAIAAIENPADVFVVSGRPYAQRAVIKFARYVGCTSIAGRYTPGAFTNQIQAAYREPRLLVVADPRADHQPVSESSYVNIPVIAFANTDSPLRFVDIAIPCNNKGVNSIGLMWWLLAREVLRLRGSISRDIVWDVMPDLFFYRDAEKEAQEQQEAQAREAQSSVPAIQAKEEDWAPETTNDWAAEAAPAPAVAAPAAASVAAPAAGPGAGVGYGDEWGNDWAAESAAAPQQWGGSSTWN